MALYSWRRCKQGRGCCSRVPGRRRRCRTRRCKGTSCPTRPRRRQLQIENGRRKVYRFTSSTFISMIYFIFYVEHDFTCSIFYYFLWFLNTQPRLSCVRSGHGGKKGLTSALCLRAIIGARCISGYKVNVETRPHIETSFSEKYQLKNLTKSKIHDPLTLRMLHDARFGFIVGTNTVHAFSLCCRIVTESWAHVVSMVTRDWAGGPFHPSVPGSIHWIGTTK